MRSENRGYALVTGASSGIGLCFATQLARDGYDIIAVSNQQEVLEEVCERLRREFEVESIAIFKDMSQPNAAREHVDHRTEMGLEVLI